MKSIDEIRAEIESFKIDNAENLEQFRIQFLSKKSEIQALFGELKNMAQENRKEFGQLVNDLRDMAQNHYNEFKAAIEAAADKKSNLIPDITRPATRQSVGSMHPISIMMGEVRRIFKKARGGKAVTAEEALKFKSAWLYEGLAADAKAGWAARPWTSPARRWSSR